MPRPENSEHRAIWDDGAQEWHRRGYSDAQYEFGVSIKKQNKKYEEFREQVADALKLLARIWITGHSTISEDEAIRCLTKYHDPDIDPDFLEQVFDEDGCESNRQRIH